MADRARHIHTARPGFDPAVDVPLHYPLSVLLKEKYGTQGKSSFPCSAFHLPEGLKICEAVTCASGALRLDPDRPRLPNRKSTRYWERKPRQPQTRRDQRFPKLLPLPRFLRSVLVR